MKHYQSQLPGATVHRLARQEAARSLTQYQHDMEHGFWFCHGCQSRCDVTDDDDHGLPRRCASCDSSRLELVPGVQLNEKVA